jgi:hypothetical protein
LLKLAQRTNLAKPNPGPRKGVRRVARVRRDEKGHIIVIHNDRSFFYRTKKELVADTPMMDILNPYRNWTQSTLG